MSSRTRASGLTLLEMLVVLTLVGMVSALMFQGYGYMLGSYQRIERRQFTEFKGFLANAWFRATLENLVAHHDIDQRFSATAGKIVGRTFSPLLSRDGVPASFQWELVSEEDGVRLIYREQGEAVIVSEWVAGTQAGFRFRNVDGGWQTRWVAGEHAQLPEAVQLRLEGTEQPVLPVTTAIVHTRKQQKFRESEL